MRRVRITFWVLVAVAIAATGGVSLIAGARPAAGLQVLLAFLAAVAVVATILAARIVIVLARLRSA